MRNSILEKITDREFISGAPALICLLLFQWTLYFALVGTNEDNLLPIRHRLGVYMPQEELGTGKSDQTSAQSADAQQKTPEYVQIVGYAPYETDSVEIVKGHFGDFNITAQLLVLSMLAVFLFIIFRKMSIYPVPFLIPLFIILTVSIFYHNYLGHRVNDKVYLESLICKENCDSGNVTLLRCRGNECWNCSKNPDANECKVEETTLKEFKVDRRKKDKALKTYPAEYGKFISLDKKDPTSEESDNNKYRRAFQDSKKHFRLLLWGLFFFFVAMISAKLFSKVRNFDDYEFRFWPIVLSIVAVIATILILLKGGGITTLVELLKLFAIILTVIGYEKINKNKTNLTYYVIALLLEGVVVVCAKDFGNFIILAIILWLALFLTLPWKKIFLIATPFVAILLLICGYYIFFEDYSMRWRLPDWMDGVSHPLYKYEIPGLRKEKFLDFSFFLGVNKEKKSLALSFFSQDPQRKICHRRDSKNKIVGVDLLTNCLPDEDDENIIVCDLDDKFLYLANFSSYSKAFDGGKVKCDKQKDYVVLNGKQVNTDPRLAVFAILKDGFSGGHTGFKENTFLLDNYFMYTDFVFCGLIAFFGIGLTLLVFISLIILIWNCNIKPKECGNNYKHFLYSNIMVIILATQAVIHIGGNLNVLPFTGVILPFLSKGGASTIVAFITLGLALGGLVSDEFTYHKRVKSIMVWSDKIRNPYKKLCRKLFQKSSAADNDLSSTNYEDNEQVNYEQER